MKIWYAFTVMAIDCVLPGVRIMQQLSNEPIIMENVPIVSFEIHV